MRRSYFNITAKNVVLRLMKVLLSSIIMAHTYSIQYQTFDINQTVCHEPVQVLDGMCYATLFDKQFYPTLSVTIYDIIVDWLPETITRYCLPWLC